MAKLQIGLGSIALLVASCVYLMSVDLSDDQFRTGWQIYWMNHEAPNLAPPNPANEWDLIKMQAQFAKAYPELVADSTPRAIAATCDFASGYVVIAYAVHGIGLLIRRRKRPI